MTSSSFELRVLEDIFSISKLPALEDVPRWADNAILSCVTRTQDELSILSLERDVPEGIENEGQWRALKVEGPLEFDLMGVFRDLAASIENADLVLCVISTFDTDYLLLKDEALAEAVTILQKQGSSVKIAE